MFFTRPHPVAAVEDAPGAVPRELYLRGVQHRDLPGSGEAIDNKIFQTTPADDTFPPPRKSRVGTTVLKG